MRERVPLDVLADPEPDTSAAAEGVQLELDEAVDVVLKGVPTVATRNGGAGGPRLGELEPGLSDVPSTQGDGELPVAEA